MFCFFELSLILIFHSLNHSENLTPAQKQAKIDQLLTKKISLSVRTQRSGVPSSGSGIYLVAGLVWAIAHMDFDRLIERCNCIKVIEKAQHWF